MFVCVWWMCTGPQQGLAGLAGPSQSESRSCSCHLSSHITFFLTGVNKGPREMSPHYSWVPWTALEYRNEPAFAHYANHIDSISDAFIRLIMPKVRAYHSTGLVPLQSWFCERLDWLKCWPVLNVLGQLIMLHLMSMKYQIYMIFVTWAVCYILNDFHRKELFCFLFFWGGGGGVILETF